MVISLLVAFIVFQLLVNIFFFWKIVNYENSRMKLFNFLKTFKEEVDKDVLRLKRALTRGQAEAFINSVCEKCGCLLPENTARTHDGHRYCLDCKRKFASVIEEVKVELPAVE